MKILYVIGAYGPHYIANEIHRELLLEYARRGHQCIVYAGVTPGELHGGPVSYHDGPIDVQRQLCDTRGQHYVAAEIGRRIFHYPRFLPLLWGLRRLLAQHPDIDVIHADAVYPIGAIVALAARNHGAAIVPSIHGGDLINYPGYGYGRYWRARRLIRWTFAQSAAVRVNSPIMARRAVTLGCPDDKLRHILVNIGDRFFHEETPLNVHRAEARASVCRQHGFAPSAPLIVSTGRLLPLKGFHDLVRALRPVVDAYPDVQLVIAGPNVVDARAGDQRVALQRTIAEHSLQAHVHLRDGLAHETEMPLYLAAADLLVAVAHIEGLNRVVAEAGTQGTPSIVSATTGISPLVAQFNAGAVVPPHDPAALAASMQQLLASPAQRAQLGAQARQLSQRFRSAVIADELLALYADGMDRQRALFGKHAFFG